jgi:N6-adenosine-specific RNA methylase IME4
VTWEGLNPPYRTIVADPPWPIRWSGGAGGKHRRATPLAYSLMPVTDIASLTVGSLASDVCSLWLWVTPDMNRRGAGVAVAESWGFRVTGEFVWEKPNIGMGRIPRNCHEILLVGQRGSGAVAGSLSIRSVQRWPQVQETNGGKTHSAKPPASLDLIASLSPGPYVELFARQPRLGWDHWGYGYEEDPAP